ncbi:MAG: hypothetical protein V5A64_05030 [Candidatus Thermoplasmatota archaeon]
MQNDIDYFLSTKTDSKARRHHIFNTAWFFITSPLLLSVGFYTYSHIDFDNLVGSLVFLGFLPYIFMILGLILLGFGIRNLWRHETIEIDSNGVTAKHGGKKFFASWNDIVEIKSTNFFIPVGYHMLPRACIVVSTNNSKYNIKAINFDFDHLKEIMEIFQNFSDKNQIDVIDSIDLLPDKQAYKKSKKRGMNAKIKEYKFLLKSGAVMFIISLLMFPFLFIFNLFNSDIWFIIFVMLLFFAILLMVAGGCGLSEKKNKK